jgi:hypothetical protein
MHWQRRAFFLGLALVAPAACDTGISYTGGLDGAGATTDGAKSTLCPAGCPAGTVCSPAGTCLPDCRLKGCPINMVCNQGSGICGAGSAPQPDSGAAPQPDSGTLPPPPPPPDSGTPPPPDSGTPPPPDSGVLPPPPKGDGGAPCTKAADCGPGKVCALPPGVCLPDCRLIGCPPNVPVCNWQTGICGIK